MLNVKIIRPLKHYFPEDLMSFGRRSWMVNHEDPIFVSWMVNHEDHIFVFRDKTMRNEI
jgi:protein-arginine kinase